MVEIDYNHNYNFISFACLNCNQWFFFFLILVFLSSSFRLLVVLRYDNLLTYRAPHTIFFVFCFNLCRAFFCVVGTLNQHLVLDFEIYFFFYLSVEKCSCHHTCWIVLWLGIWKIRVMATRVHDTNLKIIF